MRGRLHMLLAEESMVFWFIHPWPGKESTVFRFGQEGAAAYIDCTRTLMWWSWGVGERLYTLLALVQGRLAF